MANLSVLIRARDGIKFEGEALSVTSVNPKGTFDILPSHANFICTIEKSVRLHKAKGDWEEFNIENGVLHVFANRVVIYLGIK